MRRIADGNCLFFHDASLAAFADSYCNKIEIVHSAGVPGADAHSVSTVVSCTHGVCGWVFSSAGGLRDSVMDHLLRSICKARAGLMPALVYLRRTVGGRGVCVAQTCTDTRSAHKTAHIGTTRPTPRSKWLRRCAFSDLCRSSAVNLPPGGGIGVRVLPASAVLISNGDACAFLAQQEKPKTQPESPAAVSYTAYNLAFLHFEFRSRYISRYAGSKFDFLPFVVASIVAMVTVSGSDVIC